MTARWRQVRTQSELDRVIADGDFAECVGDGYFRAYGFSTVTATGFSTVHRLSARTRISGGVIIEPPDLTVAKNWLAYYGLEADENGIVVLYKAVDDEWKSGYGTVYSPGATPSAPDWRATNECGYGLHFSPRPFMALSYAQGPKFVACPVLASSIVPIGNAYAADKCKAAEVVAPGCYEVTEAGDRVPGQVAS